MSTRSPLSSIPELVATIGAMERLKAAITTSKTHDIDVYLAALRRNLIQACETDDRTKIEILESFEIQLMTVKETESLLVEVVLKGLKALRQIFEMEINFGDRARASSHPGVVDRGVISRNIQSVSGAAYDLVDWWHEQEIPAIIDRHSRPAGGGGANTSARRA